MMKILVGEFITESNANIPQKCEISNYKMLFGDDCIQALHVADVFEQAGFELIPSVMADAGAAGVIKKDTFDYIESCFVRTVKEHIHEIDGMFLMLHGASEVEGIGSGDHHILAEIRKVVGPYLPIFVVCDPHGNLCKEYAEATTLIRSYRESPHTDLADTVKTCCRYLVDLLEHRRNIHPAYRKLPLILGGEQSVSADEPVRSINQYMDEMEKDPRILSASWHVGYIRHDTDVAGCGIVVVPNSEADQDYAERKADELAAFVWERRHEFHYTGLTQEPEEAMQSALNCPGKPVFLTDSGDNTTSGSVGANTWVLRQVMALPDTKGKNFLFGCITDPAVVAQLADVPEGIRTHIRLGMDLDELSRPVELDVTVKHKGRLEGFLGYQGDYGACVLVSVEGYPIDIIVAEVSHAVVELHQFEAAGAHCADYGVVIVKQGYIFPELKALGALSVMSLTDGATLQDTRRLPFKRIMRPMFPVDDI
mgnify:CR=1 FL=1